MKTNQSLLSPMTTLLFGLFVTCVGNANLYATPTTQQDDDSTLRSELGERQRFVRRKMDELADKFTLVAERLKETEPEQSKRLIEAYKRAKETLIARNMAEASQLLDQGKYSEANNKIDTVIAKLDELVRMLTNRKQPELSKQDEIDMLEDWKNEIDKMRDEQTKQRRETSKLANKQQTLDRLKEQIKQLSDLIEKQQNINAESKRNNSPNLRELDKTADKQFKIRKKTEKLAKDVANEPKPDGEKTAENESKNDKPGESKPGESRPGESKPDESKQGESKQSESKQGESKPGESKPGESKQEPSQPKPPQPGQESLEKSADHQRKAEEKLGSGRPKEAQKEQEKALTEMEKAKSELNKEFRRLESLPPEAFKRMADKQRRNRDKALQLNKKMAEAPKAKPTDQNDQSAAKKKPEQPGQKKMQEASDTMKKASEELDKQNPKEAEKQQKKAENDLAEAKKKIEERLNQLRDETMEEKLKRLEGRFRSMLDRQTVAGVMTTELDDKTTNLGTTQRRDLLTMMQLATEELAIGELGHQAYDLLLEDGTSDVMLNMVQEVCNELVRAAGMLEDEQTNQITQLVQHEIELSLVDLLDAMAEAKKKNKKKGGGGGGGGGGGQKQPLIKQSVELKILKRRQQRLQRLTKRLYELKENGPGGEFDDKLKGELKKVAEQQGKLLEMTERVMEKNNK